MVDIDQVPPMRALPRERREALRELLTDEVTRSTQSPWWRRSRRGLTVGAGALAFVVAGGAVATAYVLSQPATDVYSVWCYSSASLENGDRHRAAIGKAVVVDQNASEAEAEQSVADQATEAVPVEDPLALCSQVWRDGTISTDDTEVTAPNFASNDVPQLTACTLTDGVAAVFPGSDGTCAELGLPQLETS